MKVVPMCLGILLFTSVQAIANQTISRHTLYCKAKGIAGLPVTVDFDMYEGRWPFLMAVNARISDSLGVNNMVCEDGISEMISPSTASLNKDCVGFWETNEKKIVRLQLRNEGSDMVALFKDRYGLNQKEYCHLDQEN